MQILAEGLAQDALLADDSKSCSPANAQASDSSCDYNSSSGAASQDEVDENPSVSEVTNNQFEAQSVATAAHVDSEHPDGPASLEVAVKQTAVRRKARANFKAVLFAWSLLRENKGCAAELIVKFLSDYRVSVTPSHCCCGADNLNHKRLMCNCCLTVTLSALQLSAKTVIPVFNKLKYRLVKMQRLWRERKCVPWYTAAAANRCAVTCDRIVCVGRGGLEAKLTALEILWDKLEAQERHERADLEQRRVYAEQWDNSVAKLLERMMRDRPVTGDGIPRNSSTGHIPEKAVQAKVCAVAPRVLALVSVCETVCLCVCSGHGGAHHYCNPLRSTSHRAQPWQACQS